MIKKAAQLLISMLLMCHMSAYANYVNIVDEAWDSLELWYSGNRTVRDRAPSSIGGAEVSADGQLCVKTNTFTDSVNVLKYLDGVSGNGQRYMNGKLTPEYVFETKMRVESYYTGSIENGQTAAMTVNVRTLDNKVYRMVISVEQDGIYMCYDYQYAKKYDGTPSTPANVWTKIVDRPGDKEWHIYRVTTDGSNAVLEIDDVNVATFTVLEITSDGTNDDVMYSSKGAGCEFYVDYTRLSKIPSHSAIVDQFADNNTLSEHSSNIEIVTSSDYIYGSKRQATLGNLASSGDITYKVLENVDIVSFDVVARLVPSADEVAGRTVKFQTSLDGDLWVNYSPSSHTFYENPTAVKITYRPSTPLPFGTKYLRILLSGATNTVSLLRVEIYHTELIMGAQEFFVSPTGSDSNLGSFQQPFKTLERAKSAVRTFKSNSGIPQKGFRVYLRGGTYVLGDTFSLETQDSGLVDSPVVYSAYNDEKVIITNGRQLDTQQFTPVVNNNILGRVGQDVPLMQFDLSEIPNIETLSAIKQIKYGIAGSMGAALYLDGTSMPLAGWPKEGYVREDDSDIGNVRLNAGNDKMTVEYKNSRIDRWSGSNMWVFGYLGRDWSWESLEIEQIDAGIITTKTKPTFSIGGSTDNQPRLRFVNILEELSEPGEWYIDNENAVLYFYPPYNLAGKNLVLTLRESKLVTLTNVSNIHFKDISFSEIKERAFETSGGRNIIIENCVFKNIGDRAIQIVGGTDITVRDCEIYDIGGTGIYLYAGNRNTLEKGNIVIDNNEIYRFGQIIRTYAPAVSMGGVGNIVSHNSIHDAPHAAIIFGQNDNIIEYNDIYNVLLETDDAGAIYSGRNWTARGNIIRYNNIYNSGGYRCVLGIYLDDMLSGTEIYGNVISDVSAGILMGGGSDNRIYNNVITNWSAPSEGAEQGFSIKADSRGTEAWFADMLSELHTNLSVVPYTSDIWRVAYPELTDILNEGYLPMRNVIKNNIIYNHRPIDIHPNVSSASNGGDVAYNSAVTENPGFAAPELFSFRTAEGNMLVGDGQFLEIPSESIGLYRNQNRDELIPGVKLSINENLAVKPIRIDNGIYLEITITGTQDFTDCDIFSAVYASDTLLSVRAIPITLEENQSMGRIVNEVWDDYPGGDSLRVYLWDRSMLPLIKKATIDY